MSIYFVRHGETDWNKACKMQGRSDIILNDTGRKQAHQSKALLQDIKIDKVYCSPLKRAYETACIINSTWGHELHQDERLMERCFGTLEGQSALEIRGSIWFYNKVMEWEGAEQMPEFFNRVYAFLDDIIEESYDKNILVVAHGGVCVPFQCYFDGFKEDESLLKYIPNNCEIVKREGKKYQDVTKG